MKRLIHKYLSTYYKVKNNQICIIDYDVIKSSPNLIFELEKIFALQKKQLKWYVKSWTLKQNRHFRFNDYWNPPVRKLFDTITFPIIRRVQPALMSRELGIVQPMGMPSGRLFHLDFDVQEIDRVRRHDYSALGVARAAGMQIIAPTRFINVENIHMPEEGSIEFTDNGYTHVIRNGQRVSTYSNNNIAIGMSALGTNTTGSQSGPFGKPSLIKRIKKRIREIFNS